MIKKIKINSTQNNDNKKNLVVFCKRSYLPKEEFKKLLLIPSILIEYIA